ncbi:RNA 2',3'-cyclic phosphodiesterase [Longitalea arenae]|uniref:RNA 2',3'-cyclic phosphodiesterase n=1 Tax=Longitalea arenae TaxID=2812558 RepID=UPI0019685381|nr:RNA 2',3'-cyclic phosphodiesterase [Longitalea arenae]
MLYFIALVAPEIINQQVLEWKHYMLEQFQCRVALKSPAHITLIPPFQMPDDARPALQELLMEFAAAQQPFPIRLHNFAAFKPRVIYVDVVPSARLEDLQSKLETAVLKTGRFRIKKEERPFHPHVTIANRDLKKEDFPKAWAYFQQLKYDVSFPAQAISLLRHNGRVWEIAGDSPLGV